MHKVFKFTAKVSARELAKAVDEIGDGGFVTLSMSNGLVRLTSDDPDASSQIACDTHMPGSGQWLCISTSGKAIARSIKCAEVGGDDLIELVIFEGGEGEGFRIRKAQADD